MKFIIQGFNLSQEGQHFLSVNMPFISSQIDADPMGRYVIVTGKLYNIPVILASVYVPNWDDAAFFTNFFSWLPDLNEHHLILGGDINCVLAPSLDRSSAKTAPTSKAALSIQLSWLSFDYHAPLKLKINLPTTKPVYRPWRLNPLLLSDEKFSDFISSQIDLFLEMNQTQNMSPPTVWEALKAYLRGQIICYNAQLRKTELMNWWIRLVILIQNEPYLR